MPVILYRVDDRLVHGQVVLGWGQPLGIGFIVLVDDTVAENEWEQDLYRMGVPAEIQLYFATVEEAARDAARWQADPRNGIVLTGDIRTMDAFCRLATPVARVNLGGIHQKPGRSERAPYVFLSPEEFGVLQGLESRGTTVTAQDLPTSTPIRLESLR